MKEEREPLRSGKRFTSKLSSVAAQLNNSLSVDQRLYAQDILQSTVHCRMLMKQNIISEDDGQRILEGLTIILKEIDEKIFVFKDEYEDIHMSIEARLTELIGDPGKRLHTARSRNDQVATDFRLWIRESIHTLHESILMLEKTILKKAEQHIDTLMPGFTHLQVAQPVTFAHHLMAYVEMFTRDRMRLTSCHHHMNECPLGATALAGTSYPIDRFYTAEQLGFLGPMRNSMDAVSDRDFVMEFLSTCSITAVHLSRLAEEIILWMSQPFSFISLPDSVTTGSSVMPQKKNPDTAELIRGKASFIASSFQNITSLMIGLPLTYAKDLQDDKWMTFQAFDALNLSLSNMILLIEGLEVKEDNMLRALQNGYPTATDLADWLVSALCIPFRTAYTLTSSIVAESEKLRIPLENMPLSVLQAFCPQIDERVYPILSVQNSVRARNSFGGTAPECVSQQIIQALKERETL